MLKWLVNVVVTSLLFFPEKDYFEQPPDLNLRFEMAVCVTEDGLKLYGWYLPAVRPKATLLFLHGNAGNISGRLTKVKGWVERGVSVLLIDYRSYGKSEGRITHEQDLYRDGEAALRWLILEKKLSPKDILLYGESLGSAPCVELATRYEFRGLILEGPFVSLRELAKLHYPWAPLFFVQDFQLNNLEKIEKIRCPLWVVHGKEDAVCPPEMGQRLFAAAPVRKEIFLVEGGSHNGLFEIVGDEYYDRPYRFFMGQESQ